MCHVCIGDQVLTKQVEEENTLAECSYCQLTKPALTLAGLSNRIRQVLEEHFIPVPENDDPEQSRQGLKDIETVIEAVAHLEQGIAADVKGIFVQQAGLYGKRRRRRGKPLQPWDVV